MDTNLVVAQGKGLGLIPVHVPASFQILTDKAGPSGQVRAIIIGPKGENLICKIYQHSNGDFVGEFTPISVGKHRIEIFYANQPVAGSPFIASAYDPQAMEIVYLPKEIFINSENIIESKLWKQINVLI